MNERLETMFYAEGTGVNERKPNFRDGEDRFYLVRCYVCVPEYGRENYVLAVAHGECAWCGAGEGLSDAK